MNKKYLNFTLILIVLSVFDIITTQYALSTYPHLSEGNPIMALVTSSFALFVLVKAVGVLVLVNTYKRIRAQSEIASKIGTTVIIMIMLLVVGNNLIVIGSATTEYNVYTPNSLEYPGRVEGTGELSYAFLVVNGSQIQEHGTTIATTAPIWDNGYTSAVNNRMYGTTFVFAVTDWAHPYRIFGVSSNKDVFYTDSITAVDFAAGYFSDGFAGCAVDGNCNDLHKIGVLTTLNTYMSGFVDLDGNVYIADGLAMKKFVRSADYTSTTLFTAAYTGNNNPQITGIAMDSANNIHVLVGGSYPSGNAQTLLVHFVFDSVGNELKKETLVDYGITLNPPLHPAKILIPTNQSNVTQNIIYGYSVGTTVYLKHRNVSGTYDICPTSCGVISMLNGLQILQGYAYIASSAENKIYRFPTTISVLSGSGYTPGIGAESTDQPELTYTTKSINSLYANYYNMTKFSIQSTILFDSGFWILGSNYGVDSQNYRWQIRLVDPNGATVNSWDSPACTDSLFYGTCSLSIDRDYTAPSGGWMAGNWYVKLYEHKVGSSLVGAEVGNLALITTSATWNVYNASISANATGTIGDPTEAINSPSNLQTISQIDGYVGLLGFGINGTSKLLFSLLIVVILFVVGLIYTRDGNIGLALATVPYIFFTYIGYIEKWIFIIYIIMLIVISRVFR